MKIVNKTSEKIAFRELTLGDVFTDDKKRIHMKTDFSGFEKAVCLETGCKVYFDDSTKIQKINATLVIGEVEI